MIGADYFERFGNGKRNIGGAEIWGISAFGYIRKLGGKYRHFSGTNGWV